MVPTTHIDFGIRGTALQVSCITGALGIEPTHGFNPNEHYFGKEKVGEEIRTVERNRPGYGVWHFSTEGLVASPLLQDHAEFLLAQFEPAKHALDNLLETGGYFIQVTVWYVGPSGFDLQSTTIARLAKLCNRMSFTFFEVSDSEDTGNEVAAESR
jgi:hypothetical protein